MNKFAIARWVVGRQPGGEVKIVYLTDQGWLSSSGTGYPNGARLLTFVNRPQQLLERYERSFLVVVLPRRPV